MSPTEADDTENWLDRLEDAEYSEADGEIHASVLKPPIDVADITDLRRLLRRDELETVRRDAAAALGALANTGESYDVAAVTDELTRAVLADGSPAVRAAAIASLAAHGNEHVDRLVESITAAVDRTDDAAPAEFFLGWLSAELPELRIVAATGLGTLTAEHTIDRLEGAFRDPDPRVRSRAIEAYGRFGERADADALEPMLNADDPAIRRAAAAALAEIGTESALESLLPAATATDDRIRRTAVERLHRLDQRRTAVVLAEAARDSSMAVRRRAIVSLVRLYTAGRSVDPRTARNLLVDGAEPSELADLAETLSALLDDTAAGGPTTAAETDRQLVWLLGEIAVTVSSPDVRCRLVDVLAEPDAVGDIAAAYLRLFEGESIESELRSVSRDPQAKPEARTQAEAVLERIKRATAAAAEERSVEYTYVRRPSDYTTEHEH